MIVFDSLAMNQTSFFHGPRLALIAHGFSVARIRFHKRGQQSLLIRYFPI